MMSFSNTTGHAIRALACLAGFENAPVHIKDLAECSDVPHAYLAKIVKILNDSDIIHSKRGCKGGIWLSRPAKLISLLDICVVMDGEDFLGRCLLGTGYCSDKRNCPIHKFWTKNTELIRKELERTKLSDILQFNRDREACQISSGDPHQTSCFSSITALYSDKYMTKNELTHSDVPHSPD